MNLQSGERIPVTGYYGYDGHADLIKHDCFIPPQTKKQLFKKGEIVPPLGSCDHVIKWKFISKFNSKHLSGNVKN